MMWKNIKQSEKGLLFRKGEFVGVLEPGRRGVWPGRRIDVVSQRAPWLRHEALDLIVRSGELGDRAQVIDLKDNQRALVWIDGRFDRVLGRGLYALWTGYRKVRVELVETDGIRFAHASLESMLASDGADALLDSVHVAPGQIGVLHLRGEFVELLRPGLYAFWKGAGSYAVELMDTREQVLDVAGQELMTADKLSLRLNAVVTWRVEDPQLAVQRVSDVAAALYRDAQLALRAEIGTRPLDDLLSDKQAAAATLQNALSVRAKAYGVQVVSAGIRDIILPGDMKELLNRVIEARKQAEANVIHRREETAAMRSQLNTAKLLESSETLMRLRELEVLEKVAGNSQLQVVLGEKGLAERVTHLL